MNRSFAFLSILVLVPLAAQAEYNFNEHVAPLVHENCASCHRIGEAAPFALITYDEVKKKAKTMRRAMTKRYMPPWHPADTEIDFAHIRELSDDQIAMFDAWVEAGMPEGDPAAAPEPPAFTKGWSLGEPDLILSMEEAYPVSADGPDVYRNFADSAAFRGIGSRRGGRARLLSEVTVVSCIYQCNAAASLESFEFENPYKTSIQ